MPPKKKPRTADTISSDLSASFAALSPNKLRPDRLPHDSLYRAYGLAGPRQPTDQPPASILHRTCPNRWMSSPPPPPPPLEPPSSEPPAPEVLVLDSADDDDDIQDPDADDAPTKPGKIIIKVKKPKGKGKGKGQATTSDGPHHGDGKPCAPDTCQNNPRCLNWLGQDKWEKDSKARKDFRKAAGLPEDPTNDRDPDTPVGLRNLGATCYANSFLQVWYRDAKFRKGVYSCLPPSNGNVEASPVFQLQVLFAFLQSSQQAVYDPDPLVEALKIKRTEQQDAQEFSKLFLGLLDYEFKKQAKRAEVEGGDGKIGRIVEEQFEGKMTYGTQCLHCKTKSERTSSFLELEVNLTKQCKLEDRIAASFDKERLDGDNQYLCERCDAKRDAVRYSYLTALPPVLHFSILRFVFSHKDFSRSKSQHAISYPLSLDMGQFLPPEPTTTTTGGGSARPTGVWYDLKGVLMHKGQSAHHGHYVAQVYDEDKAKWFLFDDEAVSPIEDLNTPTVHDEDDDPVVDNNKKKKLAAGFTRGADGSILPKSKDAYMLIYTRRDSSSSSSPTSGPSPSAAAATAAAPPSPPSLAQATVERLDAAYRADVDAYERKKADVEKRFDEVREGKRSVYRVWDVEDEDEEAFLVDKSELRRWLEDGLKVHKPASGDKGKGREGEDTNGDVEMVSAATAAGKEEGKELAKEEGRADEDVAMADEDDGPGTPAEPPQSTLGAQLVSASKAVTTTNGLSNRKDKGKGKAIDQDEQEDLPHPSELRGSTSPVGGQVNGAGAVEDEVKRISNEAVVCEHGRADPRRAEQMKRVSQLGVMALRDLGVAIEPELMVPRDLCRDCVGGLAADHLYAIEHPKRVKEYDAANVDRGPQHKSLFLSKAWTLDWRKPNPKMHVKGALADPSPSDEPYGSDILCPHGGLQPDAKRRAVVMLDAIKVIERVFPGWKPVDPDSCSICEDQYMAESGNNEELKKQHALEKRMVKSIAAGSQMKLTGLRLPIGSDPTFDNVVPKEWVRVWNNWVRHAPGQSPRPGKLDNSRFTCKHGKLCLDLPLEVENPRNVEIVPPKEWALFEKFYNAGPRINIWSTARNGAEPDSDPPVCDECLEESRKNFSTAELRVVRLADSDFDEEGNRKPGESDSPEVERKLSPPPPRRGVIGERQSRRIANKDNVAFAKSSRFIQMAKGDLVKDLKLKVEEETSIPFAAQRLFFETLELDEASASVEELGIAAGDTIEVYGVDTNIDVDQLDDNPDQGRRSRGSTKRKREEGFGGTGLFGFEHALDGVDEADAEAIRRAVAENAAEDGGGANGAGGSGSSSVRMDEDGVVKCPTCTFDNAVGMQLCEMCGSALSG